MGAEPQPDVTPPATDEAPLLNQFLRASDRPCPACGYNLRDLRSNRCPECGRELVLTLGTAEPFLHAWVTLAVATFASAGIGVLLLLIVLRERMPSQPLLQMMIWFFMLSIATPYVTLRERRRFLRLARSTQWAIALTAGSVVALALLLFTLGLD